jgi:hypothetical protein
MSEEKAAEYYVKYFDANFENDSDFENTMATLISFKDKIGYLNKEGEELAYQKVLDKVISDKGVGGLFSGTGYIAIDADENVNEFNRNKDGTAQIVNANGYLLEPKHGNVKDFNGKPKIGSFKIGDTTVTLYGKGMFSIDSPDNPTVDYITDVTSLGIYNNGSRKQFKKDDRKAMGEIAEDLLYAWMLKQCGK